MNRQLIVYENKVKCRKLAQCNASDMVSVGDRIKVEKDEGEVLSVLTVYDYDTQYVEMIQALSRSDSIPRVSELWKKISLSDEEKTELKAGDTVEWKGFKWIILDNDYNGGVFLLMKEPWKVAQFNDSYNVDWKKSTLRKDMVDNLLPILGEENLITHVTDLTCDNGDKTLGTCEDKVFILSCDEYRKYREYIPLFEDDMWTCTASWIDDNPDSPYAGYAISPRLVYYDGGVYGSRAINAYGAVPACICYPSILNLPRQRQEEKNDE